MHAIVREDECSTGVQKAGSSWPEGRGYGIVAAAGMTPAGSGKLRTLIQQFASQNPGESGLSAGNAAFAVRSAAHAGTPFSLRANHLCNRRRNPAQHGPPCPRRFSNRGKTCRHPTQACLRYGRPPGARGAILTPPALRGGLDAVTGRDDRAGRSGDNARTQSVARPAVPGRSASYVVYERRTRCGGRAPDGSGCAARGLVANCQKLVDQRPWAGSE